MTQDAINNQFNTKTYLEANRKKSPNFKVGDMVVAVNALNTKNLTLGEAYVVKSSREGEVSHYTTIQKPGGNETKEVISCRLILASVYNEMLINKKPVDNIVRVNEILKPLGIQLQGKKTS